jgi:hypothetical protein
MQNPLKFIVNTSLNIFFIILLLYVLATGLGVYFKSFAGEGADKFGDVFNKLADNLSSLGYIAFNFLRPFLQLILILVIIEWLLNKFNISLSSPSLKLDWNVQTVIALIVVCAFSIAALGDIAGADSLKDLALVVVGFYFGTQKKTVYREKDGEKSVIEEQYTPTPTTNEPTKNQGNNPAT